MKGTVCHIGYRMKPGGKPDIHTEMLNMGINSILLVERVLDNGGSFNPQTYFFFKIPINPIIDRFDRILTERIFVPIYEKFLINFFEKHIVKNNASLMHAHFGMAGYKLSGLRKKLGIPLIVTFYGVDASYCLKVPKWIKRYRRMFEAGDLFVVLAEEVKQRLIMAGCPAEKIRIWNCLVDLDSFPYKEREPGKVVRFITAARFVEKKNHLNLLEAFSHTLKNRKNAELTIIGYGPDKDKVLEKIIELNLRGNVTLIDTAAIADFDGFYAGQLESHDIFILPSKVSVDGDDEGGPALSLIAAQSAGLPVICTPFVGSERSVIDNETGLICEHDSAISLTEKMIYLIDAPELWNKLGRAGSLYVQDKFSKERQTQRMIDIYQEII